MKDPTVHHTTELIPTMLYWGGVGRKRTPIHDEAWYYRGQLAEQHDDIRGIETFEIEGMGFIALRALDI